MARRPGGDQRPAPRSVSNRRHWRTGPAVALDEDCAPIACRLVALPSPASRPSTPRRAFSQPRAGIGAARRPPGSAQFVLYRRADRPPCRHRPAGIPRIGGAARSCGPLSPDQTRSGRSGRLSAAHQRSDGAIRPSTRPWAVHVAASPGHRQPLKLPASACTDPSGTPAPPPRPPAQFPAGAGTRAHTYGRACGGEIFRKKIRERESPRRLRPPASAQFPVQRGRRDIGSRAGASDFPEAGWRRGGAPGARTGRCARGSIQAWSWLPALRRRQYVKRHTVRSRRSSYSLPSRGWSCCAPQWPLGRASVPAGRGLAGQQPAQHPHGAGPSSASAPASSGAVDCSGNRCTPARCYITRGFAAKVLPGASHSGEDGVLEHGVS